MSDPAIEPWTTAQFLAWQSARAERYELVSGVPVRLAACPNSVVHDRIVINVHNRIVINMISELTGYLFDSGFRASGADRGIEIRPGHIRRPDAGIECGPKNPGAFMVVSPRVVAEVLSPETRDFETFEKLADYQQIESLDTIIFVEPNAPWVAVWSRERGGIWTHKMVLGFDQDVAIPSLGFELIPDDIYQHSEFPDKNRLVLTDQHPGQQDQHSE